MTIRISIKNEDDDRTAQVQEYQTEEPRGLVSAVELSPQETRDFYLHGRNYFKLIER